MTLLVLHGRCRSGKRWFWAALAVCDPGQPWHSCGAPECCHGGLHEAGWTATEPEALEALRAAVASLGGPLNAGPGAYGYYASVATDALRRISATPRPDPGKLKAAMLAAHPDSGGTDQAFIDARLEYERARQRLGQA